jgi:hypothetical protein
MIDEQDYGALKERVARLESLKQRLLDVIPLAMVLSVVVGQWMYVIGQFQGVDDRLDRLEQALVRIEGKLEARP